MSDLRALDALAGELTGWGYDPVSGEYWVTSGRTKLASPLRRNVAQQLVDLLAAQRWHDLPADSWGRDRKSDGKHTYVYVDAASAGDSGWYLATPYGEPNFPAHMHSALAINCDQCGASPGSQFHEASGCEGRND